MAAGDEFRNKAAGLFNRAKSEGSSNLRAELETLAASYRRLAQQADQHELIDWTAEISPAP